MKFIVIALLVSVSLAGCASPNEPSTLPPEPVRQSDPFQLADQPIMGNPEATVAIAAFEAPGCSACRAYHLGDDGFKRIVEEFVEPGEVAYYGLQWTVGYPYDQTGGIALECGHREHGAAAYWPMLDLVFQDQRQGTDGLREDIITVSEQLGVASDGWLACFEGMETIDAVQDDIDAGVAQGGRSSPVFWVLKDGIPGAPLSRAQLYDAVVDAVGA